MRTVLISGGRAEQRNNGHVYVQDTVNTLRCGALGEEENPRNPFPRWCYINAPYSENTQ